MKANSCVSRPRYSQIITTPMANSVQHTTENERSKKKITEKTFPYSFISSCDLNACYEKRPRRRRRQQHREFARIPLKK